MIIARAPAKIIIIGEHFVVHGSHALAASIDRYITVLASHSTRDELFSNGRPVKADFIFSSIDRITKGSHVKLQVKSQIPKGAGLGSSAAISVASAIAVSKLFGINPDPEFLFEVAMESERLVHGNPSGIDVAASLYGGFILFKRGEIRSISSQEIQFIIIDSKQRRRTKSLVNRVKKFMELNPDLFSALINSVDIMAQEGASAISDGRLERLALFMNISQSFLELIGVSTAKIEKIISGLKGSIVGAKITGAGGGGCIIALPRKGIAPKDGYVVTAGVPGAYEINFGHKVQIPTI